MASDAERMVAAINTLIETCKDGEQGFRTAAAAVADLSVRELFESYAEQRARFAIELQDEVRRLGARPEDSGTATGALHRGWMNIRAAVGAEGDDSVIAEAIRGEDVARERYEAVLRAPLLSDTRAVVEHQFRAIKESQDRLRFLKRAA